MHNKCINGSTILQLRVTGNTARRECRGCAFVSRKAVLRRRLPAGGERGHLHAFIAAPLLLFGDSLAGGQSSVCRVLLGFVLLLFPLSLSILLFLINFAC